MILCIIFCTSARCLVIQGGGGGGSRDNLKFHDLTTLKHFTYLPYTAMYFDLFVPFPLPQNLETATKKGKKDKGKGRQVPGQEVKVEEKKDYWPSITQLEKERCTRSMALAGHRTSSQLNPLHLLGKRE